jgi:hypothetical protein
MRLRRTKGKNFWPILHAANAWLVRKNASPFNFFDSKNNDLKKCQ